MEYIGIGLAIAIGFYLAPIVLGASLMIIGTILGAIFGDRL